ncbi:MAG: beta-galactosidase, partial [Duncaniella sp.]|nr:beta-galactosidase [Duncaniella sp.]
MKRLLSALALMSAVGAGAVHADKADRQIIALSEACDPDITEINRLPMHTDHFAFRAGEPFDKKLSANYLSLDGKWRFLYTPSRILRPDPAKVMSKDCDDSTWDSIAVPGVWELNGYGAPLYLNSGYPWSGRFESIPPNVPDDENAVGSYRRWVYIPAEWKGRDITAHFGSVTSNMSLWVNGQRVGYGEDSKLAQEFDLTPYIIPGRDNLIA